MGKPGNNPSNTSNQDWNSVHLTERRAPSERTRKAIDEIKRKVDREVKRRNDRR